MLDSELNNSFQTFAQSKVNQSIHQLTIPELLLIQKQSDMLADLLKNQGRSKKLHNFSTEISELSFESVNRTRNNLNASISSICLSRDYSKHIDDQYSSQEILDQIRKHCSNRVYNFVRNKLRTSMQNRRELQLQKEIKYNQQLTQRCLKLSQEVAQLKVKLEAANQRLKNEEVKRVSKPHNLNIDKGYVFLKWEKSLIYKQKIQTEVKKALNKQIKLIEQQRQQNQKLKNEIINILENISEHNENEDMFEMKQIAEMVRCSIQEQKEAQQLNNETFSNIQENIDQAFKQLKASIGKLH